jgi:hypothetical protein
MRSVRTAAAVSSAHIPRERLVYYSVVGVDKRMNANYSVYRRIPSADEAHSLGHGTSNAVQKKSFDFKRYRIYIAGVFIKYSLLYFHCISPFDSEIIATRRI